MTAPRLLLLAVLMPLAHSGSFATLRTLLLLLTPNGRGCPSSGKPAGNGAYCDTALPKKRREALEARVDKLELLETVVFSLVLVSSCGFNILFRWVLLSTYDFYVHKRRL